MACRKTTCTASSWNVPNLAGADATKAESTFAGISRTDFQPTYGRHLNATLSLLSGKS
jgi:hypothetical protein